MTQSFSPIFAQIHLMYREQRFLFCVCFLVVTIQWELDKYHKLTAHKNIKLWL